MREVFSVLLEEAHLRLAGVLEVSSIEAGLQTTGWLSDGMNAESAATAAAERNVDVTSLDRYRPGRVVPGGLQLGFAASDVKEIRCGVGELAIALEHARKASHRGSKQSRR
jgi:DNA-binding transcriptional MocR family regulator